MSSCNSFPFHFTRSCSLYLSFHFHCHYVTIFSATHTHKLYSFSLTLWPELRCISFFYGESVLFIFPHSIFLHSIFTPSQSLSYSLSSSPAVAVGEGTSGANNIGHLVFISIFHASKDPFCSSLSFSFLRNFGTLVLLARENHHQLILSSSNAFALIFSRAFAFSLLAWY